MSYSANIARYSTMKYSSCGKSGLKSPKISLGLWHNFGGVDPYENGKDMILGAFDLGITHFDLANNYGPPAGSAEKTMGRILKNELADSRGQSMVQLALAWVLRKNRVTSALIGASKVSQIEENVKALDNLEFTDEELQAIDNILSN